MDSKGDNGISIGLVQHVVKRPICYLLWRTKFCFKGASIQASVLKCLKLVLFFFF
jgi:hypothetical protein